MAFRIENYIYIPQFKNTEFEQMKQTEWQLEFENKLLTNFECWLDIFKSHHWTTVTFFIVCMIACVTIPLVYTAHDKEIRSNKSFTR